MIGVCKNCALRQQFWHYKYNVRLLSSTSVRQDQKRNFHLSQNSSLIAAQSICDTTSYMPLSGSANTLCFKRSAILASHKYLDMNQILRIRLKNYSTFTVPELVLSHNINSVSKLLRHSPTRHFHAGRPLYEIERSKVEQTVKSLKEDVIDKDMVKKPIGQRIKSVVMHYWNGFRLLYTDVRICLRYVWQVLNGKSLTRRERRQLVRTTADLFRLVPFSVFIIIPFMEFLLPVALWIFPNMLPSTFTEKSKEVEKQRTRLKVKLELAKFLQDTIEDSAVKRKGAKGETVAGFVKFMEKIRSSGTITTNEEILKYAKLFEDEITLDNLSYEQLQALCILLQIPVMGVSKTVLRLQLDWKLRQLEADDRMIMKEGIDSLAVWELQEASRARGMRSLGLPESRLKSQLSQWLELHLDAKIPTSLLLLSRTLYLEEEVTPTLIKQTITELSESASKEAQVKISEVSGDTVDHSTKLEVIRQEEKIIAAEKQEVKAIEKEEKKKKKLEEEREEVLVDGAIDLSDPGLAKPDMATILDGEVAGDVTPQPEEEKEKLSAEDLEEIEEVLESVALKRSKLTKEQEDLQELKEDVTQYKEQVDEMQDVIQSKGEVYEESKAVRRLGNKVNKMIEQMETTLVSTVEKEKETLIQDLEEQEHLAQNEEDFVDRGDSWNKLLKQIDEKKQDLVSISEIIEAIHSMQKIPDEAKIKKITEVLDEDRDGIIGLSEALKVIELLGQENTKLGSTQVEHIVDLLRAEQKMKQDRKERKQREKEKKQNGTEPEEIEEEK